MGLGGRALASQPLGPKIKSRLGRDLVTVPMYYKRGMRKGSLIYLFILTSTDSKVRQTMVSHKKMSKHLSGAPSVR